MNIHKEKCKRLKEIRKKLADGLGIDLKQRECTFEGECRGTCLKCRQEEETLNRALLGKAAAVAVSAGIMLTGCQGETGNAGDTSSKSNVELKKILDLDFLKDDQWEETAGEPEELHGDLMPPLEEFELDGDLTPPLEELELDGDIMMPPLEELELDGDLMPPLEEFELDGDLTPPLEELELDGDIVMPPSEESELEGTTEELTGEIPIDSHDQ